ncbi:hypothetical protein C0J52_27427 [Blattella germanica]|nr:hypothetical protein C0J52_27427 [Blattella germanica]
MYTTIASPETESQVAHVFFDYFPFSSHSFTSFLLLRLFVVCVLFFLQCIGTIKINRATCYVQYVFVWILYIYYIISLFCIRRRSI